MFRFSIRDVLWLLSLALWASPWCALAAEASPATSADIALVSRLVKLSGLDDAESASERLRIVARLARDHEWGVKGLDPDKPLPPETQVLVLVTREMDYVAVVIHYLPLVVPGPDVQLVALVGPDGKLLDQMTCEISSRLTAGNMGEVRYEARRDTDPKSRENFVTISLAGAKGAEISSNFDCTLRHQGKTTKVPLPPHDGKDKWTIDLCHCKVGVGAFNVSPALKPE